MSSRNEKGKTDRNGREFGSANKGLRERSVDIVTTNISITVFPSGRCEEILSTKPQNEPANVSSASVPFRSFFPGANCVIQMSECTSSILVTILSLATLSSMLNSGEKQGEMRGQQTYPWSAAIRMLSVRRFSSPRRAEPCGSGHVSVRDAPHRQPENRAPLCPCKIILNLCLAVRDRSHVFCG